MATKKGVRQIISAVDIGTTKVVALIAEITEDEQVHIIGFGKHLSLGLKRGVVVNIDATMQAISRAVQEAELMAGCHVSPVYAGIAGSHIRSLNSHGIVAIRSQEVQRADISRVIDAAKAVAIPADQKILHILPQEYVVDNQEGIREPVGMAGVRLEARVHIVTGAVSAAQNIVKCIQDCNLQVNEVILEQLASSYAVLTDDEKELGVAVIDIGGGTTDIAVFNGGSIQHTAVIPIAGDQVTNDIAVALRTPTKHAEALKKEHGCALLELVGDEEMIEVPSVSQKGAMRKVQKSTLANIVEARYEELFTLVKNELRRAGFEHLVASGMVLTGGGSVVQGGAALAEQVFDMPVRTASPQYVTGLRDTVDNPMYATSVGLLLYAYRQWQKGEVKSFPVSATFQNVWLRMRGWFQYNF
jgi:cell division protein FtsA